MPQLRPLVKQLVQQTPVLRDWDAQRRQAQEIAAWQKKGRPAPPPHLIKQQTLKFFAKQYQLKILVETGTFLGDMVQAMRGHFALIYSIELSPTLFAQAQQRFADAQDIQLICGDSAVELGKLMGQLAQPTLFWLDGHYSEGITAKGEKSTPILEELTHILNAPDLGHVILIDDARCFGTDPDYPSLAELTDFIKSKRPQVAIQVEDDSIRITPRNAGS